MGLWGKLRQATDYLRKLRLSLGPDSYFQYKRGRKSERKQADRAREQAEDSAQRTRAEAARGREKAERKRGYDQRYTREREGDAAQEQTKPPEELERDG